jgi:hypothetical protein
MLGGLPLAPKVFDCFAEVIQGLDAGLDATASDQ